MATANDQKVSPAQAAAYFSQMTRQHKQTLPTQTVVPGQSTTFNLPKVRLTSKIEVLVEATLNAKHAANTTFGAAPFAPFTLIRNISIDMNNGFAPFKLTGRQLSMLTMLDKGSDTVRPQTGGRGANVMPRVASAAGADNKIRFLAELPLTLNDRDPIGLVLTQNQETTVTVTVDIADAAALTDAATGYTYALSNVTLTPVVESFSIPALPQAFPDLSILKLAQGATQTIDGAGEQTFKFPTGQTYRRIVLYLEDVNGVGFADDDLQGSIEVVFNQADRPYVINPKVLAAENTRAYGSDLPAGMFALDLTNQGFPNFGGTRDYIDTERLTEFWVRVNSKKAGKLTVVYETLTQLRNTQTL